MEFGKGHLFDKPYDNHEFANPVYYDKTRGPTPEQREEMVKTQKNQYICDLTTELRGMICDLYSELQPDGDPLKSLMRFADMAKVMVRIMEAQYGD